MRALDVGRVGYSYDDGTPALRDVSFSVEEGEKVAIVGPNGAGKSTLLHLIAGFRMPYSGAVHCFGRMLSESNGDDLRKDLGLVFEYPDDQIFMPTVEEDVAFGPRNLRLGDLETRVSEALRSAGIEHLAKRGPHKLSHGMKKRVAIAGTLAMEPRMLLLDDPTSGLDPRSRRELISLLRSMDRTMLIATHDLEAAAEIVDRAIVLNGSVAFDGTMSGLVRTPEVLEASGLEAPQVSRLIRALDSMGYPVEEHPASMDRAITVLAHMIDRGGRRVRNQEDGAGPGGEK